MELLQMDTLKKNKVGSTYSKILYSVMEMIVERYNRDKDYGWVDTKKSLITGLDYLDDDFLKGKNTIYGWIQGRALEAIAHHARWIEADGGNEGLVESLKIILVNVLKKLEDAREINGGHLFFFMDKNGKAFKMKPSGELKYIQQGAITTYNYSDLFCSKGMYEAARYLGLDESAKSAKQYCDDVLSAIWLGNFASDQFSFRGNIKSAGAILNSIGPYMLMLDAVNMWLEDNPDQAAKAAIRLVERIVTNHIQLGGRWNFGQEYDCIENIETDGYPFISEEIAESDPGHSIEFAGLALRVFYNLRKYPAWEKYKDIVCQYENILVNVIKQNFDNGFKEDVGGICKSFDLISRKVMDSDMPWWSLPETMRAAIYGYAVAENNDDKSRLLEIYRKCHLAFVDNYLRPELSYMSVQTIGVDGFVKDAIPATPDADPGYHTGVCLIDCLSIIKQLGISVCV